MSVSEAFTHAIAWASHSIHSGLPLAESELIRRLATISSLGFGWPHDLTQKRSLEPCCFDDCGMRRAPSADARLPVSDRTASTGPKRLKSPSATSGAVTNTPLTGSRSHQKHGPRAHHTTGRAACFKLARLAGYPLPSRGVRARAESAGPTIITAEAIAFPACVTGKTLAYPTESEVAM